MEKPLRMNAERPRASRTRPRQLGPESLRFGRILKTDIRLQLLAREVTIGALPRLMQYVSAAWWSRPLCALRFRR